MAALLIPALCAATTIGGGALFMVGAKAEQASVQLDVRLGRARASLSGVHRQFTMPTFLAARGKDRREVVERLEQAGFYGTDAINAFLWARLGITVLVLVVALVVSDLVWRSPLAQPLVLFLAPAITYISIKPMLTSFAKGRQRKLIAEFPFLLDLLLMMLDSGVSLDQCLHTIARDEAISTPHLNRTLRGLVDDLDRGMAYEVALPRWAARVGTPGTTDLAGLFVQALFQGIELSPALRQFAREFTERRIAAAREVMGQISIKLIIVMIVFFMPALFIVIGGPPVSSLFDMITELKK